MAGLVQRSEPYKIAKPSDTHFESLIESIAYQQLAGKAAAAIHGRLVKALRNNVTPRSVLRARDDVLRAAGLSGGKLASMKDLAAKVAGGTVPLEDIERLSDDEIVARLSVVRGIGRWTAEMFLIFQLRRPDVWPVDDYGVRKGWAVAYDLEDLPKPKQLQELGERFRPIRSAAAWYCWRAVELSRNGGKTGRG